MTTFKITIFKQDHSEICTFFIQIVYKVMTNGPNYTDNLVSIYEKEKKRLLGQPGILDQNYTSSQHIFIPYMKKMSVLARMGSFDSINMFTDTDACSSGKKEDCFKRNRLPLSQQSF